MNYSKKQMADYAGVPSNVITVWLREDVVRPLERDGRNNQFDRSELFLARILAEPYKVWGVSSKVLAQVAEQLRVFITIGYKHGVRTAEEGKKLSRKERLAGLYEYEAENANSRFSVPELAAKWGFPEDFRPEKTMSMDQVHNLELWTDFMECVSNGKCGWLSLAVQEDRWDYSLFFPIDENDGPNATVPKPALVPSFIVVDLKETFREAHF